MRDLPFETVLQILAAPPYTVIANAVVRAYRYWHALRASEPFLAARAEVDERGLVVTGGLDETCRQMKLWRVLIGGRWRERAPINAHFSGCSTSFRGELVLFGSEQRENNTVSPCCLAFNLKANPWRTLEWPDREIDEFVWACCATDSVVVALLRMQAGDGQRRCSPGAARKRRGLGLDSGSTDIVCQRPALILLR